MVNARGLLRAPWNVAASAPYVTRHNTTFGAYQVRRGTRERTTVLSTPRAVFSECVYISLRSLLSDATLVGGASLRLRQTEPPGCAWHAEQLALTGSWAEFGLAAQYRPHGKVHTLVGGAAGADWVRNIRSARSPRRARFFARARARAPSFPRPRETRVPPSFSRARAPRR